MEVTEYLTVSEVAELLKMHVKTISVFARSGRLPGVKIGRDWRFKLSDIEKMFERNGGKA